MAQSYPTGADLRARLLRCKVPLDTVDALDCEQAVKAAIADFDQRTGYHPFLASSEPETLTFRPRGRKVEFETGVVEVVSVTMDDGRALLPIVDFELEPRNAPRQGKPYTVITLRGYFSFYSVSVVCRVGYTDSLDDEVFDLILDGAGARLGPQITAALAYVAASEGGDIKLQQTGDTKIEFTSATATKTSAMKYEADEWKSRFAEGAKKRRLIVLGLND